MTINSERTYALEVDINSVSKTKHYNGVPTVEQIRQFVNSHPQVSNSVDAEFIIDSFLVNENNRDTITSGVDFIACDWVWENEMPSATQLPNYIGLSCDSYVISVEDTRMATNYFIVYVLSDVPDADGILAEFKKSYPNVELPEGLGVAIDNKITLAQPSNLEHLVIEYHGVEVEIELQAIPSE